MRHVFGPIPSRRLGQSLGIDPIPFKTCNWNCIYCQLGRSSPLIGARRDYSPPAQVVAEVADALTGRPRGKIDWLTFVGSGEPTLHASLGTMIRDVRSMTSIPVAVITNGSLLYLPEVREELALANAVLPTLDAGTETLYRKINRPMPDLSFDRFVQGLIDFRRDYRGKLWIEVMLIKGLNDSEEALSDLSRVLKQIQPDAIHLNLPIRPPCELWLEPTDDDGLARAIRILGSVAKAVAPTQGQFKATGHENIVEAIVDVIRRHPMEEDQLLQTLTDWTPKQVVDALSELRQSGKAQVVLSHGKRFWSGSAARYVNQPLSHEYRGDIVTRN